MTIASASISSESLSSHRIWQAVPVPASAATESAPFVHIPPPPPVPARRWRRAARSIRELVAASGAPDKAIEVFYALSLDEFEGWFQRFVADPDARDLLHRQPRLGDLLCSRRTLEAMPPESFGRALVAFLDETGIDPSGVLDANEKAQRAIGSPELDPIRSWFRERLVFSHDLGHVLTGYATDGVGESRLLAFALAQFGGRAYSLVTLAAGLESWPAAGRGWPRELVRSWQLGRRARWLVALPLEELLAVPLETARRAARLR